MNQTNQAFQRIEQKYILTPAQHEALCRILRQRMRADPYGEQTIASVYYDTPGFTLIRQSLEKPVYKEKLRIRSYGRAQSKDEVFVELKKKYKGVVYKRRTVMALDAAECFLNRGIVPEAMNQVQREIDNFRIRYRPAPAALVICERTAFEGPDDSGLRLTLDRRIRCRDERLDLRQELDGTELLPPAYALMELKAPRAMPLWMARALSELRVYPVSFSKYGAYYQNFLSKPAAEGGFAHVA